MNILLIILTLLFISHAIFLSIVIANLVFAPRICDEKIRYNHEDFVSILIPARNEEEKISKLLDSLLKQAHKNCEIIVLDDNSSDGTSDVVKEYSKKIDNIILIAGKPLPSDWLGKNWACMQLANYARYDLLLFLDADLVLSENAIVNSLEIYKRSKLNMLSVFPTQVLSSWGEYFIVPLMNWLLLTFLPLSKVLSSKSPALTAANGQFIMISKRDYYEIGTHKIVKDKVVEDMEIARLIKQKKKKIMTALGADSIYCSMYSSFQEGLNGFSKNFYQGFSISAAAFLFLLLFLLFLFLSPVILLFFNHDFLVIVLMIIIERLSVSILSRQNGLFNILVHPLQMLVMLFVGVNSVFNRNKKWKDRIIK